MWSRYFFDTCSMNIKHNGVCLNSSLVVLFLGYLVMVVPKVFFFLQAVHFQPLFSWAHRLEFYFKLIPFTRFFLLSAEKLRTRHEPNLSLPPRLSLNCISVCFGLWVPQKKLPLGFIGKKETLIYLQEGLGKPGLNSCLPWISLVTLSKQVSHCSIFRSA